MNRLNNTLALLNRPTTLGLIASLVLSFVLMCPQLVRADAPPVPLQSQPAVGASLIAAAPSTTLQPVLAYSIYNILGNRVRMIQVACVFMIVGISFLMWGKSK